MQQKRGNVKFGRRMKMRLSKKKWKKLKKRITKLEKAVQNQPLEIIRILYDISGENMMKSKTSYQKKE